MKFLKKDQIDLVNGGYLVIKGTDTPVQHAEFCKLQEEAHYLVSLANKVRGVDFTPKVTKSFNEYKAEVVKEINSQKRQYVAKPKEAAQPTAEKLQKEALAWMESQKNISKAEKLNTLLQKFNVIAEFEDFGLYFGEGITKLPKIYTVAEITDAVSVLDPHLTV